MLLEKRLERDRQYNYQNVNLLKLLIWLAKTISWFGSPSITCRTVQQFVGKILF